MEDKSASSLVLSSGNGGLVADPPLYRTGVNSGSYGLDVNHASDNPVNPLNPSLALTNAADLLITKGNCAWVKTVSVEQGSDVYAIVEVGGQQQRVAQGDQVRIPFLHEAAQGQQLTWNHVLLVGGGQQQRVGAPYVQGSTVQATVVRPLTKGHKVRVFKKKRRKGYHKTIGHRQRYTTVRIDAIDVQ